MSQTDTVPVVTSKAKDVLVSIPYHDGASDLVDKTKTLSTAESIDLQTVTMRDARPALSSYTLDKHGFQYVKHASALSSPPHTIDSWHDPALREQINNAEITDLAQAVTGAKKIMIVLVTGRKGAFVPATEEPPRQDVYANHAGPLPATRSKGFLDGKGDMGPRRKPHIDWGSTGVRNIMRNWSAELAEEARDIIQAEDAAAQLPGGIAQNYQGRRWAFINTWRPLRPVRKDPIAAVAYPSGKDVRSSAYWREIPGIHGRFPVDARLTLASDQYEWFWLSDQQPDEVMFMKIFDSENERDSDHVAGPVHHASFHLPGTDDEEPRESIETKFFAFW